MPVLNNLKSVLIRDKSGNFMPITALLGSPGRGIASIERTSGSGNPGERDVYTITYTDGTTSEYSVYNGKDSGGGVSFKPGNALELKDGVLNVLTASDAETDNTLPITSAAVAETVGNIEVLLKTI